MKTIELRPIERNAIALLWEVGTAWDVGGRYQLNSYLHNEYEGLRVILCPNCRIGEVADFVWRGASCEVLSANQSQWRNAA